MACSCSPLELGRSDEVRGAGVARGRSWLAQELACNHHQSVPGPPPLFFRGCDRISVGRPVRTPHLRERRLAYEPAGPGRIRASSPARRPRATHLIASPSASLSSLLQRAIPWFDPRREHSSVPTTSIHRRRAQPLSRLARSATPKGLGLDEGEHGAKLDRSGKRRLSCRRPRLGRLQGGTLPHQALLQVAP